MSAVIDFLNTIFWDDILIPGRLAVGVFLTIRRGCVQFRHFGERFRVIRSAPETDRSGITPFQALTVSLASRVAPATSRAWRSRSTSAAPGPSSGCGSSRWWAWPRRAPRARSRSSTRSAMRRAITAAGPPSTSRAR